MGTELVTNIEIGSKSFQAKVLLETDEIIIRGEEKIKIPFVEMKSFMTNKGILGFRFNGKKIQISIGENAEKWLVKIKNPKSIYEKLGIKAESKVSIINIIDQRFIAEVTKKAKVVSVGKALKESDIILYEANTPNEVRKMSSLKGYVKPNGCIWVVSIKGKAATIKDTEIMAIGVQSGLVDTKVVGFSETRTALKFVIPVANR